MIPVDYSPPASAAFIEACRLSISPHLGDWFQPRNVTAYFLEPATFTPTFLDDCRPKLTCEAAAVNATECIPWSQTTQEMRDCLKAVNPALEEHGLVIALALFSGSSELPYRRIYAIPSKLLNNGACVTEPTWKRMRLTWRSLSVSFRLAILKSQQISDHMWEILTHFERAFVQ